MLTITGNTEIHIANAPVDMRKAIDGLSVAVIELLDKSPQADAMYIFYNKSFDKIKILFWHKNGFVLFYKRLEKGKFKFPKKTDTQLIINKKQLSWLIAGLDFLLMDEFKELNYDDYC